MGCLQCWEHFWPTVEGDKQPLIPAGVNVRVSSAFLALCWEMLVKTEASRVAPENRTLQGCPLVQSGPDVCRVWHCQQAVKHPWLLCRVI